MRLSIRRKRQQQTEEYRQMQIVQDAVDDVLDNISILDNISSKEELNEAMPKLLAFLGKYSLSDRSYMFTWTEEDRSVMKMTHEWCAEGVEPTAHRGCVQEKQSYLRNGKKNAVRHRKSLNYLTDRIFIH